MRQNATAAYSVGARVYWQTIPEPRWGARSAPSGPPAGFRKGNEYEREGRGKQEREGNERRRSEGDGGEGKGMERRVGKGRKGSGKRGEPPPKVKYFTGTTPLVTRIPPASASAAARAATSSSAGECPASSYYTATACV